MGVVPLEEAYQQIRLYNLILIRNIGSKGMLNKQNHNTINYTSYLDVSEYIIKEHSPMLKATPPSHQYHDVPLLTLPTRQFKNK
jgi:hypothetical protein